MVHRSSILSHGFGLVVIVSICVVVVLLGRLKCRVPSLLLAEYDSRIGGLVVSFNT